MIHHIIRKHSRKYFPSYRFSSIKKNSFENGNLLINENAIESKGGISFHTSIIGHLSESSILCKMGESVVHAVVNSSYAAEPKDTQVPLTVDYRSRFYSFGTIPNSLIRREKHGSEDEILVARCIDRAIRPLFPKGYVNDIQITVTSHAADGIQDPTIMAVNATSYALMKSKQPWNGPIACVRVGYINGCLLVNPTIQEMELSELDLVYAGTNDRTLMIEAISEQLSEDIMYQALKLANAAVKDIIDVQYKMLQNPMSQLSKLSIANDTTNNNNTLDNINMNNISKIKKKGYFKVSKELKDIVYSLGWDKAIAVYNNNDNNKSSRGKSEGQLISFLFDSIDKDPVLSKEHFITRTLLVDSLLNHAFRTSILTSRNLALNSNNNDIATTSSGSTTNNDNNININKENIMLRSDGRRLDELRPVTSAVDVLPSVHGSAYFARGDTHVLGTVTLGPKDICKEFISIDGSGKLKQSYFMLHYDFPPYCTGELGNAISTNRRIIGHGNLAEKALKPVIPSLKEFPYTIRVYAECTSSNGSSSMASVCAASLALFDAGVPLKTPVAGISIGLVTEPKLAMDFDEPLVDSSSSHTTTITTTTIESSLNQQIEIEGVVENTNTNDKIQFNSTLYHPSSNSKYVLLKDILGSEDYNGDMDFKIAGTKDGITAIQLDVKLPGGIPIDILYNAMYLAKDGRLELLDKMRSTLPIPRTTVKSHALKAEIVKFESDRKSFLIGPRGEMLDYMEKYYDVKIDLTEDDFAYIYGFDASKVLECRMLVEDIAVIVREGDTMNAKVSSIMDYGIVVTLNRAQEAILHITEISHDQAIQKQGLSEIFKVGQRINVKILSVEKSTGVICVSRKATLDPNVTDTIEAFEILLPDTNTNDELPTFVSSKTSNISPLNTFPTKPPIPYNRNFFRENVAIPNAKLTTKTSTTPVTPSVKPINQSTDTTNSTSISKIINSSKIDDAFINIHNPVKKKYDFRKNKEPVKKKYDKK